MAADALPLLRSPPFPGVPRGVAAISRTGGSRIADPDIVFAAMRTARVGGAFWARGAADPWNDVAVGRTIVATADSEAALIGWIAGAVVIDPAGVPHPPAALRAKALAAVMTASYRDPFTAAAIDPIDAIGILGLWRTLIEANRPIAAAAGMARWKRDAIARFFWDGCTSPAFIDDGAALDAVKRESGAIGYWPSRTPSTLIDDAARDSIPTWPVEDGFIRSNGLGAECRPPMSILIDRTGGIHFDPDRPSELETILARYDFDAALLDRARRLRIAIVAARLGKYGVDHAEMPGFELPDDRRIVLAVGQVEDDLSVLRGGNGIAGNLGFLHRVRAEEPDAWILYRPHPDVVAGLRRGHIGEALATGLADQVETGGALFPLLRQVDRVHVLSSLTGFEALIRGVSVTVHGAPFYAGWGLTRDLAAQSPRRVRRLSLDALVAGALILAPRYLDPHTMLPCTPETLVARLAATPIPKNTLLTGFRRVFGNTRRALALAQPVR